MRMHAFPRQPRMREREKERDSEDILCVRHCVSKEECVIFTCFDFPKTLTFCFAHLLTGVFMDFDYLFCKEIVVNKTFIPFAYTPKNGCKLFDSSRSLHCASSIYNNRKRMQYAHECGIYVYIFACFVSVFFSPTIYFYLMTI